MPAKGCFQAEAKAIAAATMEHAAGQANAAKTDFLSRMSHEIRTVSYTHLDVYKRQAAMKMTGWRSGCALNLSLARQKI